MAGHIGLRKSIFKRPEVMFQRGFRYVFQSNCDRNPYRNHVGHLHPPKAVLA